MKNQTKYLNDLELYQAIRHKENTAYEYLYNILNKPVHNWVRINSGTEEDANDVLQDGMMSFFLNVEFDKYEYRESTKISTVVFEYCKRKWYNELIKRGKGHKVPIEEVTINNSVSGIDIELIKKEEVEMLKTGMESLKSDCYDVIDWFYLEGFSLREIAQKFGWKESSAKQKRYGCLEKLRSIIYKIKEI